MSKKDINAVKSAIRRISRYRKQFNEVKKRCKVREVVGKYKNGKDKVQIIGERCEFCHKIVEKVEVDHIIEIGKLRFTEDGMPDWTHWIPRVLCALDNLQGLCPDCHQEKTSRYNSEGRAAWKFYF